MAGLSKLAAATGAVALLVASPAAATTVLTVSSSMTATCLNAGCTQVRFTLNVANPTPPPTNSYVRFFELASVGGWTFSGLTSVFSLGTNSDVTGDFNAIVSNGGITLYALNTANPTALAPLVITVAMATTGSMYDLGQTAYRGEACFTPNCLYEDPPDIAFTGTVSPEPVTMVLLGTGLLGLGGAARRRRKLLEKEDIV